MMPQERSTKVLWVNASPIGDPVATIDHGLLPTDLTDGEHDVLHETRNEKIALTCGTVGLLFALAFLWVWYR